MTRPALLDDQAIADWLVANEGWRQDGLLLARTFTFANFIEAFGFMTRVAIMAEKMDHHPEWSNVYDTVEIAITTHDMGGLTERDTTFAQAVDQILAG